MISILRVNVDHTTHIFAIGIFNESLWDLLLGLGGGGGVYEMPETYGAIRGTRHKFSQRLFFLQVHCTVIILKSQLNSVG